MGCDRGSSSKPSSLSSECSDSPEVLDNASSNVSTNYKRSHNSSTVSPLRQALSTPISSEDGSVDLSRKRPRLDAPKGLSQLIMQLRQPPVTEISTGLINKNSNNHCCPVCNKRFQRPIALNAHLQNEHYKGFDKGLKRGLDENPSQRHSVERNELDTTTVEIGRFQCQHCLISFPNSALYLLHRNFHNKSDPWKCNGCGQVCSDVYDFNAHLMSFAHI